MKLVNELEPAIAMHDKLKSMDGLYNTGANDDQPDPRSTGPDRSLKRQL